MPEITDRDRDAFHYTSNPKTENYVEKKNGTVAFSLAKVFLYMFVGLFITAVVAFGVGAFVYYRFNVDANPEAVLTPYFAILIASAIGLFIDMLVINFVTLRGRHSILVPGIIYTVLVGVLFSMLTIVVDWRIIGLAFGITALVFLLMSAISFLTKGNMSGILVVIIGLAIGAGILSLFNWIFALATGTVVTSLYWIVEFAIFALVMFVAIFDLWRIKKIAENGAMSNNLALYCAFVIYTDFINVFIRILYFLIIIFANKK